MSWTVQKTDSFDKWWKKEKIEDSNYKYHEEALKEFRNIPLPHNRQSCIFKNTSYECWLTRLPDKARKKGKSGGFRVILILDLEEELLLLQGIFRRDNLDYKGEGGKYDDALKDLINELTRRFIEVEIK